MSPSKLTKYCACHAKWPSNIWQKFAENSWNVISNARPIRDRSETVPSMIRDRFRQSATRHATEVTFHAPDERFVLKNTTFRAPAIFPNFTKYCAYHEKWHLNFTKYCAYHAKWHLNFTKYCAYHENWHLNFTKYCAYHEKWHLTFTKYCACHTEWLAGLILVTYETSFPMRAETNVTLQTHQILRLPRKMTIQHLAEICGKQLQRHFQCAADPRPFRDRSEHDPRPFPSVRNPPRNRGYFSRSGRTVYWKIKHFALRLSFQISPSTAPTTKSDTWTSPSTAPTTQSDTWTSPSTAPTTKTDSGKQLKRHFQCAADPRPFEHDPRPFPSVRNPPRNRGYFSRSGRTVCIEKYNISRSGYLSKFHQVLRLPRKVTLELHQVLRLPRKVTLELHQVLRLPRKLTLELHQVLRLPRKVTLELHQILRLPRKLTAENSWNVISNARPIRDRSETVPSMIRDRFRQSATRHATEVTFRAPDERFVLKNTTFRAPAIFPNFTKYCAYHEEWHLNFTKYCAYHAKWHLNFTKYCAYHENWHLNFTKYCAYHAKWHLNFTKYCACHTEWLAGLILVTYETSFPMRAETNVTLQTHQILRLPRKMTIQHLAEICGKQLKRHFQCAADPRPFRDRSEHDPRPFPSVRNPPFPSVRNPPRNRSYFSRSGRTSKFHQVLRLPLKVTLELHQVLRLPRKVTLELHQVLRLPRKVTLELHQVLRLPRKVTLELHQVLRLPRKVTLELHQVLRLPRKVTLELHQVLRLPRKVTLELHQVLRLPRKVTLDLHQVLRLPHRMTRDCNWQYYYAAILLDSTTNWVYCYAAIVLDSTTTQWF